MLLLGIVLEIQKSGKPKRVFQVVEKVMNAMTQSRMHLRNNSPSVSFVVLKGYPYDTLPGKKK